MVDFDLEAPGLERFFCRTTQNSEDRSAAMNGASLPDHSDLVESRGVVDLLISYKALQALPPPEQVPEPATDDGKPALALPSVPFHVEPVGNFVVPIRACTKPGDGSLSLMPAGRRDGNEYSLYADRVRAFDWDEFYVRYHGAQFFDWFGAELREKYDVVLIDSRTGITEMSGVCTHQLADAVVLFVAANEQNLEGTRRIATSLSRKELIASRGGRELSTLIVPSRVELAEGNKLKDFSDKFAVLAGMIDPRIHFSTGAFLDLRVPYIPYYAFGENVAVREPELPIATDMIAAATRICSAMFELVPKDSLAYYRYQQANLPKPMARANFAKPPADFVGRDWLFDKIAQWLGHSPTPTLLIVGAPGSGKTSIAARLVGASDDGATLAGTLRLSGQLIVAHSCRRDDDWRPFLETMVRAFALRWAAYAAAVARATGPVPGISIRVQNRISGVQGQAGSAGTSLEAISIAENVSPEIAFRTLVQPLHDLGDSGATTPALVLIDGLDEVLSSEKETLANLLAVAERMGWPPQVKVLILSRPDSRILRISSNVIQLDGSLEVVARDVSAYANSRLGKRLGPHELELVTEQIVSAASGNFLFANLVLDAVLADAADPAAILLNVDKVLQTNHIPIELHKHYAAMIQQEVGFDTERWSTRCRPVLGVLAVASEGFTVDELADITGRTRSETADSLRILQKLVAEPTAAGQIRLFHPSFATFLLTDTEYGVSAVEAREMIASYFIGQYSGQWDEAPDAVVRDADRYLVQAINDATDRRKARELSDRLAKLVLDITFIAAKLAQERGADLRLAVATVIQWAPPDHPLRDELLRLDPLLRVRDRDLLVRMRTDRNWLPAELAGVGDGPPPGDQPIPPSARPETPEPMPTPPPTKPEDLTTDDMLRRQLPLAIRIELTVARQAGITGRFLLLIAVLLTSVLLAGAVVPSSYYYWDLLIGVYGIVLVGAMYLSTVAYLDWVQARRFELDIPIASSSAIEKEPTASPWEALPEVIALRARRAPYSLLGGVLAASPYFELALVVFITGAIVGTMSSPVQLLQLLRISVPR